MSELGLNAQNQAQVDPDAMAAIMKKVARVQKILGFLSKSQALIGIVALLSPLWAVQFGIEQYSVALLFLAPFLFGLAYAASLAQKDLSFAKVVFRNTAISQFGLLVVISFAILVYALPAIFYGLVICAVVFAGLPAMVIYQASKTPK